MARRSKPLLVAPFIPLLGIVGLFGIERFHGTRLLPAFIVTWVLLMALFFAYALKNMVDARKRKARGYGNQKGTR